MSARETSVGGAVTGLVCAEIAVAEIAVVEARARRARVEKRGNMTL
jgi:hypothetical protein